MPPGATGRNVARNPSRARSVVPASVPAGRLTGCAKISRQIKVGWDKRSAVPPRAGKDAWWDLATLVPPYQIADAKKAWHARLTCPPVAVKMINAHRCLPSPPRLPAKRIIPSRNQEPVMSRYNRRDFLKGAAAGGLAAFTISGTKASGRVLGANDRVRIAVAGIHGRGQEHLHQYLDMKDQVEVAYLVDPDSRLYPASVKSVERAHRQDAQVRGRSSQGSGRQEPRRRFDRHAEPLARAAGHLGLPGGQGRVRGEAVQPQYLRGPQTRRGGAASTTASCSTARRAAPIRSWISQIAAVRSGKYGKLLIAYGYASKPRGSIGFKQPKEPPKELDFDLWLGPGAAAAISRKHRALQLALVLGLRQRGDRQPGRAPDGPCPLGHARRRHVPTA